VYSKLFSKILTSSIWLAPDAHRIVWITLLAAKDKDGFAQFSSIANLASTARVELPEAIEAIKNFEKPDADNPDDEFGGRRVERVPGGWLILNAQKYDAMVDASHYRELNRERVRRYRAKRAQKRAESNAAVTPSNDVTHNVALGNVTVMQSNGGVTPGIRSTDSDTDTSTATSPPERTIVRPTLESSFIAGAAPQQDSDGLKAGLEGKSPEQIRSAVAQATIDAINRVASGQNISPARRGRRRI
jgi:hypothetical protein